MVEQTINQQKLTFADYFQMMMTGRQKLLTILFLVFLGTLLIYKAHKFGSEKVNGNIGDILTEDMDQVTQLQNKFA